MQPSDDEILEFISTNGKNKEAMTDFFLKLERPLTPKILIRKAWSQDRTRGMTLLAAFINFSYFRKIIRLASVDALHAALLEEPVNSNSSVTMHTLIVSAKEPEQIEGVLELIEKIDTQVLNTVLAKEIQGDTPLILSMANQAIFLALLNKADKESINDASKTGNYQRIIDHLHEEGDSDHMRYFISKLETQTINFLIAQPAHTCANLLAYTVRANNASQDRIINNLQFLFNKISPEALAKLTKQSIKTFKDGSPSPFLITLINLRSSSKIIHTILSGLDQQFVNEVLWNESARGLSFLQYVQTRLPSSVAEVLKKPFSSSEYTKQSKQDMTQAIIHVMHYITPDILFQSTGHPSSLLDTKLAENISNQSQTKTRAQFFIKMSHCSASIFNFIIEKLLLSGYHLILPDTTLTQLNTLNLNRYLLQAPEIDPALLLSLQSKFNIFHENPFIEKINQLEIIKNPPLEAYQYLTQYCKVPSNTAQVIIEYMIEDFAIRNAMIQGINSRKLLMEDYQSKDESILKIIWESIDKWSSLPAEHIPVSYFWPSKKSEEQQALAAQARLYGYDCKTVKYAHNDKNGFLNAIILQLAERHLAYLAPQPSILINKLQNYMMSNVPEYKTILNKNQGNIPLNDIILAFSRTLNVTLVILKSDGTPPNIYKQKGEVPVLYLGYDCQALYYSALIHNPAIESSHSLATLLENTLIDQGPTRSYVMSSLSF